VGVEHTGEVAAVLAAGQGIEPSLEPPGAAGSLAVVAEDEYRYVKRDLRRIAVVFTGIFGLLLASWLLIVVVAVAPA
jgi:hypothetical protein